MSDDLVKRLRRFDWVLDECDEAADRIEELEAELLETQDRANAFATKEYYTEMRAERAEAKLAEAVEALRQIVEQTKGVTPEPDNLQMTIGSIFSYALMTLAELKGQGDGQAPHAG